MRFSPIVAAITAVLALPAAVSAQSSCDGGFNLAVACNGIGFGSSARLNGIRINWSDSDLDVVNGVNLTLWRPRSRWDDEGWMSSPGGTINGLALGTFPAADYLNGVSVGLGAALARRRATGLTLGLLAAISEGKLEGVNVGGLAVVSEGALTGINLSGLATVDELRGMAVAGYNRVRDEQRGLTIGVFNRARALHGVQIGLLNYAGNNPPGLRWLPIINLHLDD